MADPNASVIGPALAAGQAIAQPRSVGGGFYALVPDGYTLRDLNDITAPLPKIAKANFDAYSPDALIDYVKRHGTAETAIFADIKGAKIVGVIDYHGAAMPTDSDQNVNKPGRLVHRVVYSAPLSDQWRLWNSMTGQWHTQGDFARFVEENRVDVVTPDGATLLEIVKTLEATKGVQFRSGVRLDNQQVQINYQEQIDGKAGPDGKLTIPTEIEIGIPVFYNGDSYKITAFFRYKIDGARLSLKIDLHRTQEIFDTAFRDIIGIVRAAVSDVPLYEGALVGAVEFVEED